MRELCGPMSGKMAVADALPSNRSVAASSVRTRMEVRAFVAKPDMRTRLDHPPLELLRGASLFLDFDGTLVEIAERPDAVQIDAMLVQLLGELEVRLSGRLALISGRPAQELRNLLGIHTLFVVGSHGLEFHWRDGPSELVERPRSLGAALRAMHDFAARNPGVLVEDKPLGAALHFRQAPEAEAACLGLARQLADQHQLHLQHGKMMAEVRATGGDKGSAIRRLMAEPGLELTHPVFLGDDLTDEAGFATVAEMGGAGILIGPARDTAARYCLGSVGETLNWLRAACETAA